MTIPPHVARYTARRRMTLREWARLAALSGLAAAWRVSGRLTAAASRPAVQFTLLHHVLEDEAASFRALLETLASEYRFVPYSDAADAVLRGVSDGSELAISFDDGLRSCLDAAKIMTELGISACFFVCGDMIGEKDPARMHRFCATRLGQPPMEFLSWDDLETLLEDGHEIGAHTMSHLDLGQIETTAIEEQAGRSFELLAGRLGPVRHFAWPYGQFDNFSAEAARIVFDSGFETCASGVRGCHAATGPTEPRAMCLRRDNLLATWPADHARLFLARNRQAPLPPGDSWPPGWLDHINQARAAPPGTGPRTVR